MPRALATAAGALAALALAVPSAAPGGGFPRFGRGCVRADFRSGGAAVRAERCGPASGPRAVIVLHGCGGFGTFDHRLAAELPAHGIATLDVDLFALTPPPPGGHGFCDGPRQGPDPFPVWAQVAAAAAASLRPHYAQVGAVGWSLGAGVALATAERVRPFAAVAAFSAEAAQPLLAGAGRLPPTIFLDGGRHDIVPPENARALFAAARAAGVPAALFVYRDGTHEWAGRQGTIGIARAAAFLRAHLR